MQVEKYSVSICDKAAVLYSLSCNISSSNCYLNFFSICRIISSSIHLTCKISTSDAFQLVVTFLSGHFTKDCFGSYITPNLFLVDQPHFCENSREPPTTVEHYPIPSGEDLAQSPQSSEGRVPKMWSATVFKHVENSSRSKTVARGCLGRPRVPWRSPCLAHALELSYNLCSSLLGVVRSVDGV